MTRIKITSVFLKNKGYVKTADEVFAEVNDPDMLSNEEISSIDSRLNKMYNETNLNFWYDVCE